MTNRTQGLVSAYEKWRMDSDTDIETLTAENARLSGLAANEVLRTARLSAENAMLREALTDFLDQFDTPPGTKYASEIPHDQWMLCQRARAALAGKK